MSLYQKHFGDCCRRHEGLSRRWRKLSTLEARSGQMQNKSSQFDQTKALNQKDKIPEWFGVCSVGVKVYQKGCKDFLRRSNGVFTWFMTPGQRRQNPGVLGTSPHVRLTRTSNLAEVVLLWLCHLSA